MEVSERGGTHDITMASRKAEETAWRRFQAAQWLESLVGPLGISNHPSEKDFISCLRNGIVLCNAINKIHPGAVPKVVESQSHLQSFTRETQPLPAYQYFENVRNFLVAAEELKLPAFEACDLERDAMEAGSSARVVDCILALKSCHEWKDISSNGNGFFKHAKSPLVIHSANKMHTRSSVAIPLDSCRRLDMSSICGRQLNIEGDKQKLEDYMIQSTVKFLVECLLNTKENIDENLLVALQNRDLNPTSLFRIIMSSYLEEELQNKQPELYSVLKDSFKGRSTSPLKASSRPLKNSYTLESTKRCKVCLRKSNCHHKDLVQMQEKELMGIKALLLHTKNEFSDLQSQLQRDLKNLGTQVCELSTAALGYHGVVEENRKLHNMVQDLKGSIRVYCRVRPSFIPEARTIIDFIGEDGSLVLLDPSKPGRDGKKFFNFNKVFGPATTQDKVFKETQPLIRSVMDGYNVCIFAYGQTGSGKTHTMSGPSRCSTKDMGINYLALNDLFQISNNRKDIISYDICVQMVEIYNEQVRDLLTEDASTAKLEIRSCIGENGFSLPNATTHSVKSTSDVLNLMKLGEMNRVVSSTAMNDRSSRSHSVLTVHVNGNDASGGKLRSCLHLVDLAGSERVDKSEVTGDRLKEAQYINRSLSCLGDVITALAQKNSHIPYRNSKLTLLLQDSLGGQAKTLMFAHVSPEEDSFGETISTLKFAQRVSTVELGAARMNKESSEVMQLKEQIESLKKALANKEAQSEQLNKTCEKPRALFEKTPPRPRRMSIENCGIVKIGKPVNIEERKGMKTPLPTRSRRSSLEGARSVKKDVPSVNVVVDDRFKHEQDLMQKSGQYQDIESATKNGSYTLEESRSKAPPRSPISVSYQKQAIRTDNRTQIPSLQLPKTPERPVCVQNELQNNKMTSQLSTSKDYQTPNLISSSTNGKGSHIRKSLRTIGKLINGSEKRNLQNLMEAQTSTKSSSKNNDERSPIESNLRTQRRQSLIGIETLGSYSRRSSLGGRLPDNYSVSTNDNRNAKTPPPVRSSTKLGKRWL